MHSHRKYDCTQRGNKCCPQTNLACAPHGRRGRIPTQCEQSSVPALDNITDDARSTPYLAPDEQVAHWKLTDTAYAVHSLALRAPDDRHMTRQHLDHVAQNGDIHSHRNVPSSVRSSCPASRRQRLFAAEAVQMD